MKKEKIIANWSKFEKRPPWGNVTSRELSDILGVSLQTINNWNMRGFLPEPEPRKKGLGNKNRYQICKVQAIIEGKCPDDICWLWIHTHINPEPQFESLEQAKNVARICYDVYGIEETI